MTKDTTEINRFWSGLIMGGVAGGSLLYFFGTKEGREKLRGMLDALEGMDKDMLKEFEQLVESGTEKAKQKKFFGTDVSEILNKIESSLPIKK